MLSLGAGSLSGVHSVGPCYQKEALMIKKMFLLPRAPHPAGILYCGNRTNRTVDFFFPYKRNVQNQE